MRATVRVFLAISVFLMVAMQANICLVVFALWLDLPIPRPTHQMIVQAAIAIALGLLAARFVWRRTAAPVSPLRRWLRTALLLGAVVVLVLGGTGLLPMDALIMRYGCLASIGGGSVAIGRLFYTSQSGPVPDGVEPPSLVRLEWGTNDPYLVEHLVPVPIFPTWMPLWAGPDLTLNRDTLVVNATFLLLLGLASSAFLWLTASVPPGLCRWCRYDMTGNESGTCPECGVSLT